jgi:hypothetical protein
MATVKESIKGSLVGATEEPQLSKEVRANFMRHAKADEQGELYMGQKEFLDAIAPAGEDYVSFISGPACLNPPCGHFMNEFVYIANRSSFFSIR